MSKDKQFETGVSDLPTGLASPARRALAAAGVERLEQLAQFSEAEVLTWHGIGPNACNLLRQALAVKSLSFIADKEESK